MPEPFPGLGKFVVEMGDTLAAKVLQLHPFQVTPDPLGWVQLRRIAGKLLQVNPAGRAVTQVLLDYSAPVDGSPVPQHQQLSRDVPRQVLEKTYHVYAPVSLFLHHQVELAFWSGASHSRQVVSAQG